MPIKNWDGSDLKVLTAKYLNKVTGRLNECGAKTATVRFGIMGTGLRPNYEITFGDKVTAFTGNNHERNMKHAKYKEKNLSRIYTYAEIEQTI